jgi:hypothetical protein
MIALIVGCTAKKWAIQAGIISVQNTRQSKYK